MEIKQLAYKVTPIKFWPYTSIVTDRIIDIDYGPEDREIQNLEQILIDRFNNYGIPCQYDNKIVFECIQNGRTMFIGFKDWTFSIGFGVTGDHINKIEGKAG